MEKEEAEAWCQQGGELVPWREVYTEPECFSGETGAETRCQMGACLHKDTPLILCLNLSFMPGPQKMDLGGPAAIFSPIPDVLTLDKSPVSALSCTGWTWLGRLTKSLGLNLHSRDKAPETVARTGLFSF